MAPTKDEAEEASLIDDLLALEPRLEAELADEGNHSPLVRTPLLNVLGDISHLKDSLATDAAVER